MLSRRAFALRESGAELTCRGLLYGWDGSRSCQLLPVAISYSWGWERRLGIAITETHENLLHSQEASKEPRKPFPLNS